MTIILTVGVDTLRVLVVDDNNTDRMLMENMLSDSGFRYSSAKNGDEALALFSKQEFDAALIDWKMPPTGGLNLCQDMRDIDHRRGGYCYIIMITAKKEREDEIRALESGVDDFISKPLFKSILIARLNAGLRTVMTLRDLYNKKD